MSGKRIRRKHQYSGIWTFNQLKRIKRHSKLCTSSRANTSAFMVVTVFSVLYKSVTSDSALVLVTLVVAAAAAEIISLQVMRVLTGMYKAVSTGDDELFYDTLTFGLLLVIAISATKSVAVFAMELLALRWRQALTNMVHRSKYIRVAETNGIVSSKEIEPLDQRITQDIDRLTGAGAKLLADIVVLPAIIIYYSTYLAMTVGWFVVLVCVLYFLFGSGVSYFLASGLLSLVYNQEALEGIFRSGHCRYQKHRKEIELLRGEQAEQHGLCEVFERLVENTRMLLRQRLSLNAFSNLFAYSGSICKSLPAQVSHLSIVTNICHCSMYSELRACWQCGFALDARQVPGGRRSRPGLLCLSLSH